MQRNFHEELEYNARCKAAIEYLKLYIKDAKRQLKTSIDVKTLELVLETVDLKKEETEEVS